MLPRGELRFGSQIDPGGDPPSRLVLEAEYGFRLFATVVREDGDLCDPDLAAGCKRYFAGYPVPVRLCVVGQTVSIDADIDFIGIVYPNGDSVYTRRQLSEIVAVRCGQRILHAVTFSVDPYEAFPVDPFKSQDHILSGRRFRNTEFAGVPCRSDILLFGLHPEDHFRISRLAPFFV